MASPRLPSLPHSKGNCSLVDLSGGMPAKPARTTTDSFGSYGSSLSSARSNSSISSLVDIRNLRVEGPVCIRRETREDRKFFGQARSGRTQSPGPRGAGGSSSTAPLYLSNRAQSPSRSGGSPSAKNGKLRRLAPIESGRNSPAVHAATKNALSRSVQFEPAARDAVNDDNSLPTTPQPVLSPQPKQKADRTRVCSLEGLISAFRPGSTAPAILEADGFERAGELMSNGRTIMFCPDDDGRTVLIKKPEIAQLWLVGHQLRCCNGRCAPGTPP